jgi:3-isopropylmalate/(R)-2-methylmalate dehydratase small subunit
MQPFRIHSGRAVPLDRANVDTDQIIPKQFLKRIERTGYGEFLFYGWRYRPDGTPEPSFILNDPRFRGASIVLAGKNFGCGSSREHAAWALLDHGFRAIIAPSFADIFSINCTKNGILTAVLEEDDVAQLMGRALAHPGYTLTVDLGSGKIQDDLGFSASFHIEEFRRKFLLEGLDDIGLTLKQEVAIVDYEKHRKPCLSPASE